MGHFLPWPPSVVLQCTREYIEGDYGDCTGLEPGGLLT
jgi:hypothetical protein